MTTRREWLIALGAGVVWGPLQAVAQQTRSMPVVGVLSLEVEDRTVSLREGLRKLGYEEGRNIRLEMRNPGDRYAQLAEIAHEFVRLKVDIIVAMGSTATITARKVTATIPIVMVAGIDPVREKLAKSLSHPGGNVTGVTNIIQELSSKRLELTQQAMPGLRRLGILWNPDSRTSANSFADAQKAAKTLKLQLQVVEARSPSDFDNAFETLAKSRTNVFVLMASSVFAANYKQLLESAAKHRMAGVVADVEWVERGALFAYGASISEAYRHAAVYVDKILKGAKPGDLPIEQPTRFELVINMKTAKVLGIKIPQSMLVRADRLIE